VPGFGGAGEGMVAKRRHKKSLRLRTRLKKRRMRHFGAGRNRGPLNDEMDSDDKKHVFKME